MKLGETDKNSGSGKLFVVGGGFLNMGVLGGALKKFGALFGCAVLGVAGVVGRCAMRSVPVGDKCVSSRGCTCGHEGKTASRPWVGASFLPSAPCWKVAVLSLSRAHENNNVYRVKGNSFRLQGMLGLLSLKISGLGKNFEKVSKKRLECFAGIRKSPTFASAFEKEVHQEEFFERFKINKQVVQDLL